MRLVSHSLSVLLSAILVAGSPVSAQSIDNSGPSDVQELHLQVTAGGQSQASVGKTSGQPISVQVTDGQGAPVSSATVLLRLPANQPSGVFSDGSRVLILYTDMQGRATAQNIHWGDTPGTVAIRITATKGTGHAGLLFEQAITSGSKAPPVHEPQVVADAAPPQPAPRVPAKPGQPKVKLPQEPVLIASTAGTDPSEPPSVVITNSPDHQVTGASGQTGSKKKWIWIGIGVAAAAGAALAFVGHGSSPTSSTPAAAATSVGAPTVSIGHP